MNTFVKKIIPNNLKEIIKKFLYENNYKKYKRKCKKEGRKEYLLFGTPIHGNLGDHAIAYAEYEILKDCNIEPFEVPTYERRLIYDFIKNNIENDAVILITGGGSIGSQWIEEEDFITEIIKDLKKHKIIIFPQTIFYKEDDNGKKYKERAKNVYKEAKELYLCVREEKSYKIANELHTNSHILLVPDIVLYLQLTLKERERKGILMCIRSDVESNLNDETKNKMKEIVRKYDKEITYTDTVINEYVHLKERKKILYNKLSEFSKSRLIITDRLHGMIFATITQTPCIAMGNYNHKVKGVYEWIKKCNYVKYIENIEQLEENINILLNLKNKENYSLINKEYEKLKEIL